ncbi:Type II secretory pathway, pullulanase PulA [Roseovarius sp. A46]|uniref:sulfotransferase family 2 domain-containing protein n=1 Tax=Roseovarius sp. A46 TaxID=2109331 RepID=UPI001010ACAF|nr:sulfotransferase family 2 domain-containing protein [Roseovarius sp. A46]RXV66303.1 Type II secretory pathway, pullulanase PulA [Roseovarius sp. A46]
MILSRDRGYIFVHIPKTGGTSLAQALEARATATDILIGDTPKARRRRGRVARLRGQARGRLWKHSTLADIDGLLTPAEIATMFTVTLVRNPWDRMVSYYNWARAQSFDHPAVRLARARNFAGFVAAPETRAAWAAQPARHYMTASDGQEYARLCIRLEAFEADAGPLWQHLGFRLDLPRLNTSARGDYRGYYSDRTAAIVADIAAEDIARFDYCFDPHGSI